MLADAMLRVSAHINASMLELMQTLLTVVMTIPNVVVIPINVGSASIRTMSCADPFKRG